MAVGAEEESWTLQALCAQQRACQPDDLFVRGAAQRDARRVCFACPVRLDCLADALEHRTEWGVWGGMTERERRAMLKSRTHHLAWRELLELDVELLGRFAEQRAEVLSELRES